MAGAGDAPYDGLLGFNLYQCASKCLSNDTFYLRQYCIHMTNTSKTFQILSFTFAENILQLDSVDEDGEIGSELEPPTVFSQQLLHRRRQKPREGGRPTGNERMKLYFMLHSRLTSALTMADPEFLAWDEPDGPKWTLNGRSVGFSPEIFELLCANDCRFFYKQMVGDAFSSPLWVRQ